jgi:hypothetical protein
MKLSKERLQELKNIARYKHGTVQQSTFNEAVGHIEVLEQELSNGFQIVVTNTNMYAGNFNEKKGYVLEVRELNNGFWVVVSGKYKGHVIHKSLVHDCDIPEVFTQLTQENLQRLEEVQGLQRQVKSLTELTNKKIEQIRQLNVEVSSAWTAHNAEVESRIYLESALERAMLDHQSVVLPKDVAEAIEYFKKDNFTPASFARLFFTYISEGDRKETIILERYVKEIENGDLLLKALVNGYTVEPENIVLSKELDKAIKCALDTHLYKEHKYLIRKHREIKKDGEIWYGNFHPFNYISTELLERVLVEGYEVEQTQEEANEAAFRAGMEALKRELDDSPSLALDEKREILIATVVRLVEEIYKH